jgi:uncharacterized protein YjbJ (UPF0337 family)
MEDEAKGNLHKVKGIIKEKIGEVSENPNLEAEGRAEKNAGKILNWVGHVEKVVGQ